MPRWVLNCALCIFYVSLFVYVFFLDSRPDTGFTFTGLLAALGAGFLFHRIWELCDRSAKKREKKQAEERAAKEAHEEEERKNLRANEWRQWLQRERLSRRLSPKELKFLKTGNLADLPNGGEAETYEE